MSKRKADHSAAPTTTTIANIAVHLDTRVDSHQSSPLEPVSSDTDSSSSSVVHPPSPTVSKRQRRSNDSPTIATSAASSSSASSSSTSTSTSNGTPLQDVFRGALASLHRTHAMNRVSPTTSPHVTSDATRERSRQLLQRMIDAEKSDRACRELSSSSSASAASSSATASPSASTSSSTTLPTHCLTVFSSIKSALLTDPTFTRALVCGGLFPRLACWLTIGLESLTRALVTFLTTYCLGDAKPIEDGCSRLCPHSVDSATGNRPHQRHPELTMLDVVLNHWSDPVDQPLPISALEGRQFESLSERDSGVLTLICALRVAGQNHPTLAANCTRLARAWIHHARAIVTIRSSLTTTTATTAAATTPSTTTATATTPSTTTATATTPATTSTESIASASVVLGRPCPSPPTPPLSVALPSPVLPSGSSFSVSSSSTVTRTWLRSILVSPLGAASTHPSPSPPLDDSPSTITPSTTPLSVVTSPLASVSTISPPALMTLLPTTPPKYKRPACATKQRVSSSSAST
jgi:hypothetical protein